MRRSAFAGVMVVSLLSLSARSEPAASQPPEPSPVVEPKPGSGSGPPAPYTPVRWSEDYRYLKDPARRTDLFDPLKYIQLNDAGDWYLSVGGQVRYRYELYNNNNFSAGPQDDTGYHLGRALLHADLHMGEMFRVFVQGKSALEDGRTGGARPSDKDTLDVHQAFADAKLPLGDGAASLTLRGGRQELLYGVQRVIGIGDWTNTRRSFEGGKFSLALSQTNVLDGFLVRPVTIDPEEPNDGDGNTSFAGLYDMIGLPGLFNADAKSKLELYALGLFRTNASYPTEGSGLDEDRYTIGGRFSSTPKPFDIDIEGAYQFGNLDGGDISAWMFAAEAGYTVGNRPLKPRLFTGLDLASGDSDPGDGDSGTYNQLFPTGHMYFGYIDVIGRQNIIDVHPGVELQLAQDATLIKKLSLRTDYHLFWRQSDDDAVYNSSGSVLRADGGSDESYIGSEVDVLLNWQIDRHMAAYFGYSHFFAGDFISDTGPSDDIDFIYIAVSYTF
jgi:hypothetical protein